MHLPRTTGQVGCAIRVAALTTLTFLILPAALVAQAHGSATAVPLANSTTLTVVDKGPDQATGKATAKVVDATDPAVTPESESRGAANPAPEPNTLVLLGTGTVVLLLLYARRRVRVLAPAPGSQI